MEEPTKSNKNLILAAAAVVIILVIAAGGFFVFKNKENLPIENLESENKTSQTTATPSNSNLNSTNSAKTNSIYKDGNYTVTGSYFTPGGDEVIGVSVTLKDGVIVNSEVTQQGKNPTAKRKQADFAENFKSFVICKNIDQVNLTVVSGSSLTTQGYNDALMQIKAKAKS
jgi:hypothetical protein